MAKQIGPVRITGTIDGISFYKSGGEYFARMKGGPSRAQVTRSPAFARVRENYKEFGRCSAAGKLLCKSLLPFFKFTDPQLYRRLAGLITQVKNCDQQSLRGERTVGKALKYEAAKILLKDFDFNPGMRLDRLLLKPLLTKDDGTLVIKDLLPITGLVFPAGASYVILSAVKACIDFDVGTASVCSYKQVRLARNARRQHLVFVPDHARAASLINKGLTLYFLQVSFYCTQAGHDISLNNGQSDALGMITVEQGREETPNLFVNARGRLVYGEDKEALSYTSAAFNSQTSLGNAILSLAPV